MTSGLPSASGAAALHLLLAVSLLFSFAAAACAPQPLTVTREPSELRLVAADSCRALARASATAYEAAHPWVTVTTEVFNNALAADSLRQEEADLALLSWGGLNEGKKPLWMEALALNGIAVIVHPGSPFLETSLLELREVFRAHVQEHQGVVLTVVSREDGSGTRAAFESVVLDGEETTRNAVVMPSNGAVVDYVASTPSAIGYVSTQYVDDRVRVLPVDGVLPTGEAVATGTYPLWRQLYVASHGEPAGEARQFAQWLLREGGGMVRSYGLGPGQ